MPAGAPSGGAADVVATFERLSPGEVAGAAAAIKRGKDRRFAATVAACREEAVADLRATFRPTGDLVETVVTNLGATLVHAEPDGSCPPDLEVLRGRARDELYELARLRNPGRKGQLRKTVDRPAVNTARAEVTEAIRPVLDANGWAMPSTIMLCENEDLLMAIIDAAGRLVAGARSDRVAASGGVTGDLFGEDSDEIAA